MRLSRLAFFPAVVLGSSSLSLLAQSPAPEAANPAPVFRSSTQAVVVDVVVTRGKDEPVTALGKQDFQVFEDGKAQTIDFFEEHAATNAAAPALPELPPHVFSNALAAPPSDSVNVLLLDSLNTPAEDQAYVHKQIAEYLRNPAKGTRVAIFALGTSLRMVQGFTEDNSLLLAALGGKAAAPGTTVSSRTRADDLGDKEELEIQGELSYTKGADGELPVRTMTDMLAEQSQRQGGQRASITLAALQQLARALGAIPGRKNLIWFASSFPVSIYPNGPVKQTLNNGKEIGDAVRQTASLLTQAKVAVYPVSARGVLVDRTTNADSAGQPIGDDFARAPSQETIALEANRAAMEQLATDTGGRANYTTNNLSQAMAQAIQNGAHYYTLAFTPANKQMDGRYRRIEVRVTEGRYKLSYRRGYYADNAKAAASPAADPLPPLLARGMPSSTQVLYQTRVLPLTPQPGTDAPRAGGNSKLTGPVTRYKVDFAVNPATIQLEPAAEGHHIGRVEVAIIAYDREGKALNWTGNTLALDLNPDNYARVEHSGIPVHLQIDLPQAEVNLATGVYDFSANKAGTLEIPVHPEVAASTVK